MHMAEEHGTELESVTNYAAVEGDTRGRHSATHALLVLPEVCGHTDVRLAHEQMRVHLTCRIERCAWKAAAYRTLVSSGRLTPQVVSHRERAAARGMRFPSSDEPGSAGHGPDVHTLQEVLERLSALAAPPEPMRG